MSVPVYLMTRALSPRQLWWPILISHCFKYTSPILPPPYELDEAVVMTNLHDNRGAYNGIMGPTALRTNASPKIANSAGVLKAVSHQENARSTGKIAKGREPFNSSEAAGFFMLERVNSPAGQSSSSQPIAKEVGQKLVGAARQGIDRVENQLPSSNKRPLGMLYTKDGGQFDSKKPRSHLEDSSQERISTVNAGRQKAHRISWEWIKWDDDWNTLLEAATKVSGTPAASTDAFYSAMIMKEIDTIGDMSSVLLTNKCHHVGLNSLPIMISFGLSQKKPDHRGRSKVMVRITSALGPRKATWKSLQIIKERLHRVFRSLVFYHKAATMNGVRQSLLGRQLSSMTQDPTYELTAWLWRIVFQQTEHSLPLLGWARVKYPVEDTDALLGEVQKALLAVLTEPRRWTDDYVHKVALSLLAHWYKETASRPPDTKFLVDDTSDFEAKVAKRILATNQSDVIK